MYILTSALPPPYLMRWPIFDPQSLQPFPPACLSFFTWSLASGEPALDRQRSPFCLGSWLPKDGCVPFTHSCIFLGLTQLGLTWKDLVLAMCWFRILPLGSRTPLWVRSVLPSVCSLCLWCFLSFIPRMALRPFLSGGQFPSWYTANPPPQVLDDCYHLKWSSSIFLMLALLPSLSRRGSAPSHLTLLRKHH